MKSLEIRISVRSGTSELQKCARSRVVGVIKEQLHQFVCLLSEILIDLIINAENIRNYCGQIISLMTERFVFFIKDSRRHVRLDGCSLQIVFKFWIKHCCIVSFWRHVMIKWTSWMVVLHISLNLPRHGSPWVFAWRWTLSLSALKKNAWKLIVKQGGRVAVMRVSKPQRWGG